MDLATYEKLGISEQIAADNEGDDSTRMPDVDIIVMVQTEIPVLNQFWSTENPTECPLKLAKRGALTFHALKKKMGFVQSVRAVATRARELAMPKGPLEGYCLEIGGDAHRPEYNNQEWAVPFGRLPNQSEK